MENIGVDTDDALCYKGETVSSRVQQEKQEDPPGALDKMKR